MNIGYCKFCGQSKAVTEDCEDFNEHATMHCGCDDARQYRWKIEQMKDAKAKIELYAATKPQTQEFLIKLVEEMQKQNIIDATIRLSKEVKLKFTAKADNEINIQWENKITDQETV